MVTVNDYLASRDAAWMGKLYNFLGLSVGVNLSQMPHQEKQKAYAADITYGTNNEYGFDYLRDNMVYTAEQRVQRGLHYAVVDEVDSILIDEARTPLIISGQADDNVQLYGAINAVALKLTRQEKEDGEGDYWVDEKSQQVLLSEAGHERAEALLMEAGLLTGGSLYDAANITLVHHLYAALRAHSLFHRDQHYVVRDGEIVIVDEFTGRMMPGRRWSHGIHQAVEAKEGVAIQRESITYATITFQNFFRLYDKLAGMTGTAETEAEEFAKIYGLDVVVIPTNRPMIREDHSDLVFLNEKAKFDAVVEEIIEKHQQGRPVLVGTTSIEKSEYLSTLLTRRGIPHEVLNAKQHEREAQIVAKAGQRGAVTIATNMAGRGTDIKLGPGVADLGGLHVIGTERHESRRIDNQLRGRAGRQGDPGSSRFFVSFGDDIMKRFAPDWVPGMMQKFGMTEDMPLESRMVTRAIEQAQTKVEGHNFDIRKRLVEFDDVINEQRAVIYAERDKVLDRAVHGLDEYGDPRDESDEDEELPGNKATVLDFIADELEAVIERAQQSEPVDYDLLRAELGEMMVGEDVPSVEQLQELGDDLYDELLDRIEARYEEMEQLVGSENMRRVENWLLLESIDYHWREHLTAIEELRQSIGLQAYAQVDPLVAFKREGYDMFQQLQENIRRQVARTIFRVRVKEARPAPQAASPGGNDRAPQPALAGSTAPKASSLRLSRGDDVDERPATPAARDASGRKVGRNDPCFCGSGKKYKKCHGKVA
ncbi:MAG: preprotein translocase subunit SecA [Dehalococcoidia bacterium]